MKTNYNSILFALCITTFYTCTMEIESFTYNSCQFLKLPDSCLDLIIFLNKPKTIGALKNTCKKLSYCASIERFDQKTTWHFNIKNSERSAFFKRITQMDNPDYIEKLLKHGARKALLFNKLNNETIITIDESLKENELLMVNNYLQQNYLPLLLKYAIKNNTYNSTITLLYHGAKTIPNKKLTPLNYATQCNSQKAINALEDYYKTEKPSCIQNHWPLLMCIPIIIGVLGTGGAVIYFVATHPSSACGVNATGLMAMICK